MATPVKETDRIRFPDSDRCVSCCLENKQRYYIIRKDKNKGPAFEIVCYCYKNNLCIEENVGTYVCSPCYKLLLRIKDMDCRRSQLYDKVMMSSQTFIKVISVKKRSMAIGTPGTPRQSKFPDKRATPDQGSLEKQSRQQTVIRKPSTRSLFLTPSKKASSSFTEDLAVPFSPGPQSSNQQKRIKSSSLSVKKTLKHTVSFRSSKLCEQMLPIVKSLANGSFKKALSLLVNSSDHATKENAKKAVKKLIEQECCVFSKQTNEFEVHLQKRETRDLENFNMKEIQKDFESHAPMLWACATQAATSGYSKTFDQVKVCAALCVLLQGRSKMLNSLQHVVAITMYNNQLQKDGFSVLAKLGFSVTHTTLNEKLNTAKKLNEQVMKTYQRRLADTIAAKSIVDRVSTEHSYAGGLDQPSVIDEHSYSTIYHSEFQQHGEPLGYRFNLDNLDFHIKVREMTQEHQNVSRHFTQIMSVVDRVSCEGFTDEPVGNLMEVENSEFLPTAEDNYTLRKDMIQVVSNILIEHLSSFKIFENICPKQFQHAYSAEMSKKSIVIPLGILLKNENKTNDMIEILEHLQQYVPGARTELEEIQEREETNPKMQAIPVGGDQLTCERIRGAHMARLDGDTQEERLEGLITMVEDFHEKINFLQAMMDRFYKPGSARETGTLYQLRNVINRRNVTKNVSADYHAVGSFIDLVTSAHVIAAALKAFGMDSIEDPCPKVPLFTESADEGSKKRLLDKIVGEIVDTFFLNSLTVTVNRIEDDETAIEGPIVDDGVYNYATNVTKYGLLRKISVLATRNGDGIRQIRHWKYGLLVYDLSHKIKYRLESFLLLAGVNALFTEKQRHQIIWNRFVNLSGGKDKNLDGDYVMELLNKYAKGRVKLLGPNQTPEIVDRIGKTMMFCHNVNEKLEREIGVHPAGIHHAQRDKTQDIKAVVNQLKNANVFSVIRGRQHDSFQEQFDMFQNVNSHALHKWLNVKKQEYSNGKYAF